MLQRFLRAVRQNYLVTWKSMTMMTAQLWRRCTQVFLVIAGAHGCLLYSQVHTCVSCTHRCTQVFLVFTGAHMCFLYSQVHTGVSCRHRCTQVFLVLTGAHRCFLYSQVHTGVSCTHRCTQVFIVLTGAHMCFLYSQVHTGVSCTHRCTQVFLVDTGAHRCLYCALRIHSADYAVERCLSVCLSICTPYTPVFRGHRWTYPQKIFTISFSNQKAWQYSNGNPLMGASNARGYEKNRDFRPTSGFISEMMQDRIIVTMEGK